MLSDVQYHGLLHKSKIYGCYGLVIVLFASYKRAFILDIRTIDYLKSVKNKKSLNISKIDKWEIPYIEISTIPSKKQLLNYCGDLQSYVNELELQIEKLFERLDATKKLMIENC